MKHLGNILHLANSGKLIVRSEQMPPAHAFVYTNDKQQIGKVYNVFGPVKNPYISVSLFKSVNRRDLESRVGEKLYVSTKKDMKQSKSRGNNKYRKKSKDKSSKNKNSKDKRSKSNKRKNKSKRFNKKITNNVKPVI